MKGKGAQGASTTQLVGLTWILDDTTINTMRNESMLGRVQLAFRDNHTTYVKVIPMAPTTIAEKISNILLLRT